jgi:hypothetical protein
MLIFSLRKVTKHEKFTGKTCGFSADWQHNLDNPLPKGYRKNRAVFPQIGPNLVRNLGNSQAKLLYITCFWVKTMDLGVNPQICTLARLIKKKEHSQVDSSKKTFSADRKGDNTEDGGGG